MTPPVRVAFVVSHPIQYYVPLYRLLAQDERLQIRVFYTWHAARGPVQDHGFKVPIAWDIPLTSGYDYELVPNMAPVPGTHSFLGLVNPGLVGRVMAWKPDIVHVTGWAWLSHLHLMYRLHRRRRPFIFRGDSHLLDDAKVGARWRLKRWLLSRIYRWPTTLAYVGGANRRYFEAFGATAVQLAKCPHSIDVGRFAGTPEHFEAEAQDWRERLGLSSEDFVVLYAGKFETKKQPVQLARAFSRLADARARLIMVGDGPLRDDLSRAAEADPRIRILPFANQSLMPVVYRLGDVFVLPSAYGETWGLSVNEALASSRPAIVSDHVGCAEDVIEPSCGFVYPAGDMDGLFHCIGRMMNDRAAAGEMRRRATSRAWYFDVSVTVEALRQVIFAIHPRHDGPSRT